MKNKNTLGAVILASAALAVPALAQNETSTQQNVPANQDLNLRLAQTVDETGNTVNGVANNTLNGVNGTVGTVGNTANNTLGVAGNTLNNTLGTAGGTLNGTLGTVGNTATGVVGSLNPTLQPIGEGVGGALNNLTQPQTVQSLLEFLSSVIPNHIEAHVNLDSLRVEKITLDIRGVDLRNLRVDLLVANSRNAGQVRPALNNYRSTPAPRTAAPSSFAPRTNTPRPNTAPAPRPNATRPAPAPR